MPGLRKSLEQYEKHTSTGLLYTTANPVAGDTLHDR